MNRVRTCKTASVRKRRLRGSSVTMVAPAGDGAASRGSLVASERKLREVFKLNDLRQEAADLYKPPYVFCSEYYKDYSYSASSPASRSLRPPRIRTHARGADRRLDAISQDIAGEN